MVITKKTTVSLAAVIFIILLFFSGQILIFLDNTNRQQTQNIDRLINKEIQLSKKRINKALFLRSNAIVLDNSTIQYFIKRNKLNLDKAMQIRLDALQQEYKSDIIFHYFDQNANLIYSYSSAANSKDFALSSDLIRTCLKNKKPTADLIINCGGLFF